MKPTIPKGWRKLRVGTEIKRGDAMWNKYKFEKIPDCVFLYWNIYADEGETFIRRIRKPQVKTETQYTGHIFCKRCNKYHWMYGGCTVTGIPKVSVKQVKGKNK